MRSVVLGGAQQWISVAGEAPGKPVLLLVHGGPGAAETPWIHRFLGRLEERFTVVSWDQRGAGKSWRALEPRSALTVEQLVADTVELSQALAAGAPGERIFLAGHSFGAALAAFAAQQCPGVFHALVAVAPLVNTRENDRLSWERAREEAGRRGEVRARQDLDAAGPPPYTGSGVFDREFLRLICAERFSAEAAGPSPFRQEALRVLARAPEYTPEDRGMYWKAYAASFDALYPQLADLDLEKTVPRLDVPVHVALGRHDGSTIPEIGERWLRGLDAPAKKLVWFERSGHAPAFEEPEKFVEMLGQMVLHGRGGGSPIG